MKTLYFIAFALLSCFSFSQVKDISFIEFMNWTSQNNIQYTAMVTTEDIVEQDVATATIRVKYTMNGITKVVEFAATVEKEVSDHMIELFVMGGDTAQFVKGSGNYTPDNFILSFDYEGTFMEGFQMDHNELEKGDDAYISDVTLIPINDANHFRELIKEFYTSSDPFYRDLMLFVAQYD